MTALATCDTHPEITGAVYGVHKVKVEGKLCTATKSRILEEEVS